MREVIQLPEFKPDQSNNSAVLLQCNNVFPALDGYRAVSNVDAISDALAADFQGGGAAIASDGDAYLFAGTAAALYSLQADASWSSLATGLTVTGRWKVETFKDASNDDYAILVNGTTDTYQVDLDTGTASVIAAAPGGSDVAVIGDHVVIARPDGDLSKVAWSAFGDHTAWTLAVDQAGEQPMRTGGPVQAIVGGEYGIILQRNRIVRMTLTGDADAPFQFDEITSNYGCAAPNTVTVAGRTIFFRSDRGFMALEDGQVLQKIGSEKVDRTFAEEVSRNDLDLLYTAVDPENNLVFWFVPGTPGKFWTYNFELGRWSTIEANAKGIFPGFTTNVSLDDLPGLGFTDIDAMTISLDDPRWSGGNPRLYLVDNDNKLAAFAGDRLAPTIELGNLQLTPGRRTRLRHVRPIWDGISGMTVTVDARQRLGDDEALTLSSSIQTSGIIPLRVNGKFLNTEISVVAATTWGYIQSLEFDFEPGGER